jgi:hypothetical protein
MPRHRPQPGAGTSSGRRPDLGEDNVLTQTATGELGKLGALMDGPVITPADAGFDDRRRVWNAQIDRRPSVIARCTSAADVARAVGFARERRLEISVRPCGWPVRSRRRCRQTSMP